MFDKGSLTLNRGTLDPLQNNSYQDIGNVHNKPGNLPITTEALMQQLIKFSRILVMFAYKTTYEKVEKPKPDKKFKQNSYEEIRKIVEDGGEMKLKETIKTRNDNNKTDNKIKLNVLEQINYKK